MTSLMVSPICHTGLMRRLCALYGMFRVVVSCESEGTQWSTLIILCRKAEIRVIEIPDIVLFERDTQCIRLTENNGILQGTCACRAHGCGTRIASSVQKREWLKSYVYLI